MALSDILGAIRDESEREIAAIAGDAAGRVSEVLERARREAATIEDQETHARDQAGRNAADRIVNQARLDADRLLREAREDVFRRAHDAAATRLAAIRSEPGYEELVGRLMAESRAVLPAGGVVKVDPRDVELVSNLLRHSGITAMTVEPVLENWGGLEVWAEDGRRVTNTLETRMEKAAPHLRSLAGDVIPELRSTPS